ncbi:AAA ATPase [Microbotryomycetes sp. JL201]|nr:AAA ATPase [Microbotryomycetes sp. JL201]
MTFNVEHTDRKIVENGALVHAQAALSSEQSSSNVHCRLVGRTQQRRIITDFVRRRYNREGASDSTGPGTLYLSGPPGCGKTAVVRSVAAELEAENEGTADGQLDRLHMVMCNCSSITLSTDRNAIWSRLGQVIGGGGDPTRKRKACSSLAELKDMIRASSPLLLILDEVDHMERHNRQEDLVHLIAISNAPNSAFTLIGVANSLDLPARRDFRDLLAKQKLAVGQSLIQLHFKAYSAAEMTDIVRMRLNCSGTPAGADTMSIPFTDAALRLCTAKIAGLSGDIRTVFSILRAVLQQLQAQEGQKASTSGKESFLPCAGPAQVAKAIAAAQVDQTASAESSLQNLQPHNLIALAAICVAWLRSTGGAECVPSAPTDTAYTCYRAAILDEGSLRPVGLSEFVGMCDVLEAAGLIHRVAPTSKSRKARKGPHRTPAVTAPVLMPGTLPLPRLVVALENIGSTASSAASESARICRAIIFNEMARAKRNKDRDRVHSEVDWDSDALLGARGRKL